MVFLELTWGLTLPTAWSISFCKRLIVFKSDFDKIS